MQWVGVTLGYFRYIVKVGIYGRIGKGNSITASQHHPFGAAARLSSPHVGLAVLETSCYIPVHMQRNPEMALGCQCVRYTRQCSCASRSPGQLGMGA